MNKDYHQAFMDRAVELSSLAVEEKMGLPIGCVIVRDGVIIAEGHNEIFHRCSPLAHGEMVAIERACKNLAVLSLSGCDLYTTLEPCPMCMSAIYWANIRQVYFACSAKDAAEVGFDDVFIYQELMKAPLERRILGQHVPMQRAFQVLLDWRRKDEDSAQHWQDEV